MSDIADYTNRNNVTETLSSRIDRQRRHLRIELTDQHGHSIVERLDLPATRAFRDHLERAVGTLESLEDSQSG